MAKSIKALQNDAEKLTAVLDQLEMSVDDGTFLPFLSSGASSIRAYNEKHWAKITARISRLATFLKESAEQENVEDRMALCYLQAFAESNEIDLGSESGDVDVGSYYDQAGTAENLLFDFQVELTRLSAKLVGLFGKQMMRTRSSVSNLKDYKVQIVDPDSKVVEEIHYILGDLFNILDILRNYLKNVKSEDYNRYLEADAIFKKLIIFCFRIGEQLIENDNEFKRKMYDSLATRQTINHLRDLLGGDLHQRDYLRLDELAWMEDLLWHSLGFDVPTYLTMAELTFRLSLTESMRVLRRLDLPQLAGLRQHKGRFLGGPESPIDFIQSNLKFCKDANPDPTPFHLTIAAALWLQYLQGPDNYFSHFPVAITLNFDNELEDAFKKIKKPFHVVFPVLVDEGPRKRGDQEGDDNRNDLSTAKSQGRHIWIWRTYDPPDYGERRVPKDEECSTWKENEVGLKIHGPIIIKLHGSPLERLPDTKIGEKSFNDVEHNLILSEYDYLRASVRVSSPKYYPDFLEAVQMTKGTWWFLGYDSDDWYIRLRLFQHLSYNLGKEEADWPRAWLLNLSFDYVRTQILASIDVDRVVSNLSSVTAKLISMKAIRAILAEAGIDLRLF